MSTNVLATRFIIMDPIKILDLQENDTAAHIEDLSPFVPPGTKAILIVPERVTGTGYFMTYPRSHATKVWNTHAGFSVLEIIKNQELKWKNSAANDDWDIYLLGYFVEKRTR